MVINCVFKKKHFEKKNPEAVRKASLFLFSEIFSDLRLFTKQQSMGHLWSDAIYCPPNEIMTHLTFHKWLVSVCNIHNNVWMVLTKPVTWEKWVSYYFIRLMIYMILHNMVTQNCNQTIFWKQVYICVYLLQIRITECPSLSWHAYCVWRLSAGIGKYFNIAQLYIIDILGSVWIKSGISSVNCEMARNYYFFLKFCPKEVRSPSINLFQGWDFSSDQRMISSSETFLSLCKSVGDFYFRELIYLIPVVARKYCSRQIFQIISINIDHQHLPHWKQHYDTKLNSFPLV